MPRQPEPAPRRLPVVGLGHEFGKLWAASTVSSFGDGITLIAGSLLAASLTRDPVLVAGLAIAQQLAWMLFTLPSGAVVDRVDRRRLMATVCLVRAAGLGVLGVAVALGQASLALLYTVFFVVGLAGTGFDNASTAMVPAVVGKAELERANGRLLAASMLGRSLVAAPLGGLLFGLAAWSPFLLDAGALVLVAVLSAALPASANPASANPASVNPAARPAGIGAAIADGMRWLLGNRLLRTLALTVGLSNVGLGAVMSIMVLVASERLGVGPVGYGLLLATAAVGGIGGSLVAGRVVAAIGAGTTLRAGLVIELVCHLGLALSTDPVAAGLVLAVLGLHLGMFSTVGASLRQAITPPELLGRVHSAYRLATNTGMLAGAALGGLVGRYFGLVAPFWLGAVMVAVLLGYCWRALNDHEIRAARQAATAGG